MANNESMQNFTSETQSTDLLSHWKPSRLASTRIKWTPVLADLYFAGVCKQT